MGDDLRHRYAEADAWITTFLAESDEERRTMVASLLGAAAERDQLRSAAEIVVRQRWYERLSEVGEWRERAETAEATLARVHDVADVSYGHWVRPDGSTDLFALGRHDMLDRVKAALDPASAATWGKGESDLPGDRP